MPSINPSLKLSIPCRCGFCLLNRKDVSPQPAPSSPSAVEVALETVVLGKEEKNSVLYNDRAACQPGSFTLITIWEEEEELSGEDDSESYSQDSGSCTTPPFGGSVKLLSDDSPPSYAHSRTNNDLSQSHFRLGPDSSLVPHPCRLDHSTTHDSRSRTLSHFGDVFETQAHNFSDDKRSLVEIHASSSGSLVFDHLKFLLSELNIPDHTSPKDHVGWAFEGCYTKPKPSPAFDVIPYEFTMPSLKDMKARINRLESERLPPRPRQKPIVLKTYSPIPAWGIMPCVRPTLDLEITPAAPCPPTWTKKMKNLLLLP